MRWFISDLHFGHKNIIDYCSRPFQSVDEMDHAMLMQWNLHVQPDDHVYVVGDVTFHNPTRTEEILSQLQGHKHLILGNHDYDKKKVKGSLKKHFVTIEESRTMVIEGVNRSVNLYHYPLFGWDKPKIMIHGHSHNYRPLMTTYETTGQLLINVSVENIEYTPIPETRISEFIKQHEDYLKGDL